MSHNIVRILTLDEVFELFPDGDFILRDVDNGKDWLYDDGVYISYTPNEEFICLEEVEKFAIIEGGALYVELGNGNGYAFNLLELVFKPLK